MILANMSSDLANQITCIARDMAQTMEKSALPECPLSVTCLCCLCRLDLADQNLKEVILVKNYATSILHEGQNVIKSRIHIMGTQKYHSIPDAQGQAF